VTEYLSPEQVLFLHSRVIEETGGAHGIRELEMLLSSLARSQATFDDTQLYPDLFSKTAALMDTLVRNHPFVDGNKRAAITASGIFLLNNRRQLVVENSEMVRFTLARAQSQLLVEEIAVWFQQHSTQIEPKRW
jgi:death-on-curing protein